MLFVERSNRTERLLEGLAQRLMAPGRDPLALDIVVVQGAGMERWIAQSIAREYGVCANAAFPFPRDFLERVFRAIPDESLASRQTGWEVGNLTWRIAKRLVESRDETDFAPLARQLHAVDGNWRLVQLAYRIADLLDQYLTYRPDWISAWTNATELPEGRDERWQARLLRELTAELGGGHIADRATAFRECVTTGDRGAIERRLWAEFPGAIEIFAVSTLPPLYLSVVEALARIRDVHLSVLSPSRHYWADLWSELKSDASIPQSPEMGGVFNAGLPTPAASFLAGLGRLGGEFQRNLEQIPDFLEGETDRFETPSKSDGSASLLSRFQTRLLDLDDSLEDAAGEGADRFVSHDDDSIRIHVCHGVRRELEVTKAALRRAFERDETLRPEDVIVMLPKIDDVAADIEVVFGAVPDEPNEIPYRIADRGVLQRSPVAEAFRCLLDLLGGRAERSHVVDWLAREPVRAFFGLDEGEVETLAAWAERAGIRFGFDEEHRALLGLPRERAHSWSGGIDRLVLAHAVGVGDELLAGLSPSPLDAMGDPRLLGVIGDVESVLSAANRSIRENQSVAAWCSWLQSLLERTLNQTDENAHEHSTIRGVLVDMAESSAASEFDQPIPFEAIRERVAEAIDSTVAAQPFLSGGVTFCELMPLRAIPFRVVAILGMCNDAFPRSGRSLGFDLMAREPRPGDRTTRNDDRYLFLEALLSVRDQLIITVPGLDVRDGSELPASVVVLDFVEALDSLFDLDPSREEFSSFRDWLIVSHPLQAFSPRYFESSGDSRLVSSDREAFSGALAHRAAKETGGAAVRQFLVEPTEAQPIAKAAAKIGPDAVSRTLSDKPTLTLDEMIERFLRSTRFFSRRSLRLRLPRPEQSIDDLDPVDSDALLEFGLGATALSRLRAGATVQQMADQFIANASMPTGIAGRLMAGSLRAEVEKIARVGLARRAGEALEDLDFELNLEAVGVLGECRLVGRLDRLWPGGRIDLGFSRLGRRAELDLWIRHLTLCALVDRGADRVARSAYVGRAAARNSDDRVVVFEKVSDPMTPLTSLFEWAWNAADMPLPFFPKTAWAFAEKAMAGKIDQAWRAAHHQFEGSDGSSFGFPESEEDLDYARLWEGWSPLDSTGALPVRYRFEKLALQFFDPLFEAREVHRE